MVEGDDYLHDLVVAYVFIGHKLKRESLHFPAKFSSHILLLSTSVLPCPSDLPFPRYISQFLIVFLLSIVVIIFCLRCFYYLLLLFALYIVFIILYCFYSTRTNAVLVPKVKTSLKTIT